MDSYKLTACNHPAARKHPMTGQPMIKDGKPLPLIEDQKCVKLDGLIIAYVMLKTGRVCFIQPEENLGSEIVKEVKTLAEEEVKTFHEALAESAADAEADAEPAPETSTHFVPVPDAPEVEPEEDEFRGEEE